MNGSNLANALWHWGSGGLFSVLADTAGNPSPKWDLSIEGMRSQQFSVGVFFFMLIGVIVFSGIIYAVAFGKFAPKTMKRGEKVMFAAVIMGTLLAVIFGGMQLVGGDLF